MDEREINARLLADPDDDELSILGDALQAIGDPRGELIALQLGGQPLELDYGLSFDRGWFTLRFEYSTHYFTEWQPFAPWIQTIRVRAAGELLERFLEDLVRTCPHLETLALHVDGPTRAGESCDAIQWALDLVPGLRTFELECDRDQIRALGHPTAQRLHVIGWYAAHVLLQPDTYWPEVTELAFERPGAGVRRDGGKLHVEYLPALRTIDLSRLPDGKSHPWRYVDQNELSRVEIK